MIILRQRFMRRFILIFCILTFALGFCYGQTTYNLQIVFQRGTPDTSLYRWGAAIAGIGDVNKDGYDDVAVGCFRLYSDQDTAKVFVYYGAAVMDTVHDLLISDWSGGHDGLTLCGGDINGDSFDDIIICRGKVYIHYGSSTGPSIVPNLTFGGRLYESFTTVATGDLNGDDTTDLIVGDFWNLDGNGHVYIYKGSAAFDTIPWIRINGHGYESFGSSLASGGDVNNDGYEDLAVGAFNYNFDSRGRVYVFHGGNSMDTIPEWWEEGSPGEQWFGAPGMGPAVCKEPNYFGRLWAGQTWYPGGYMSTKQNGRVDLFYGGVVMDSMPDMTVIGWDTFNFLGSYCTTALIDSGGRGDLICGAPEPNGIGMGRIWTGKNVQDTVVNGWITGRWNGDQLGVRVANAGDVNGDGREEIMFVNNADTNRLVVICKYTGPEGVAGEPEFRIQNSEFKIYQNSPNPFSRSTIIKYQLAQAGKATLKIYNIQGQLVKTLVNEDKKMGIYKVGWNGRDNNNNAVCNGVYIYKLETGGRSIVKKMTLIK